MTDQLLRLKAYALISYFDADETMEPVDSVLANRPCLAMLVDELRGALMPPEDSSRQAALDS